MSYHIYQTEAWILGGVDVKEDSRYIDIFSRELGLVRGLAQGVRKLKSKLKYGLQDFSRIKISLVKGREVWRIVGLELASNDLADGDREIGQERMSAQKIKKEKLELVARIFSLLKRLVKGEEKDILLFDEVDTAISFLHENSLDQIVLKKIEIVMVYRILHQLGYIPQTSELNFLTLYKSWQKEVISFDDKICSLALRQINNSLSHSHL